MNIASNKIIKTLECLGGAALKCRECPYFPRYEYPFCQQQASKDAIALINHQKVRLKN